MITNLLRRLEKLEALMAPPEPMKVRITVVYIGADGRPTGEVKHFPEEGGRSRYCNAIYAGSAEFPAKIELREPSPRHSEGIGALRYALRGFPNRSGDGQ
jgi:hypothetical protein